MPGTEALLHISEMKHARVEKTEDVVKKGDRVKVKLIERDERGRLRLSMKALEPKPEGMAESHGEGNGERGEGDRRRASSAAPRGDRRAAPLGFGAVAPAAAGARRATGDDIDGDACGSVGVRRGPGPRRTTLATD